MANINDFINYALNSFMQNRGNSGQPISSVQQNYIDTLKSGDRSRGEELATNLCNAMGVTKEQAILQARQYFHI